MSAEAVGYSQLISDDEAAAVTTLGLYRQVLSDHIVQHRNRVIDFPRDNLFQNFNARRDLL